MKNSNIREPEICYSMSKDQFYALAQTRENKKISPYRYVMDLINATYGLLGTVTALQLEG